MRIATITSRMFRYYGQMGVIPIAVLKEESNVGFYYMYLDFIVRKLNLNGYKNRLL